MGVKSLAAKIAASIIAPQVYKEQQRAVIYQQNTLSSLISKAVKTAFGKAHHLSPKMSYAEFKSAVPVRDYEDLTTYIERVKNGEPDVLWQGLPLYFCKSSGTTSGAKYIPLTKESIGEHIRAARNSLMMYVAETGKADFFDHKMIFLQGSPELDMSSKIPVGRLSGIVYHHVPAYLNKNRMPTYEVNCIEDWEEKVKAIAAQTAGERMSLISGIPPWVVMYFEELLKQTGKEHIKDIFPDFEVFAYGGVNYEPYRQRIETLIGKPMPSVETYPASEGFIAYQDTQQSKGLLLNINAGMFYEFVKPEDADNPNAERISIEDVELNVNYALLISSNAGLWAYSIGDTVKFISKNPYRIIVTGRVKHFISAFGEHVIGEEVEYALLQAARETGAEIAEFTVAPMVAPEGELPYHEWFVEFSIPPNNLEQLTELTDRYLQNKNVYYFDLREGNILQRCKIRKLQSESFHNYMKSIGKLGGQNKLPRLSNDRKIAEALESFVEKG